MLAVVDWFGCKENEMAEKKFRLCKCEIKMIHCSPRVAFVPCVWFSPCMGLPVLSTLNLTCLISQMSMSTKLGPALGMLPPDLKPMFDPRYPIEAGWCYL